MSQEQTNPSASAEPLCLIGVTAMELVSIMAALRIWQQQDRPMPVEYEESAIEDAHVDELCERINVGPSVAPAKVVISARGGVIEGVWATSPHTLVHYDWDDIDAGDSPPGDFVRDISNLHVVQ